MRCNDHFHAVADIDIQRSEIVESNGPSGCPIATGVHDDPISVSDVDYKTFAKTWAEDGDLDFMRRGVLAIHVPEVR
jgi:hypothetical protein